MKKIGFFGGTFDPIHFGHINLAIQLFEKHRLDEVLFCPAARSPFKEDRPPGASPGDRMAMAELAIADIGAFRICKIELERPGLSYTVDTLRALKERFDPAVHWYILLSGDTLAGFHRWKESEEIVRLATPIVGSRGGAQQKIPRSPVRDALRKGLTETDQFEVSSTQIRDRLKKKLYCGHLLPAKVLDYIEKNNLY
jgi:nicotinate-nucleotide adenylyltransferase